MYPFEISTQDLISIIYQVPKWHYDVITTYAQTPSQALSLQEVIDLDCA